MRWSPNSEEGLPLHSVLELSAAQQDVDDSTDSVFTIFLKKKQEHTLGTNMLTVFQRKKQTAHSLSFFLH